MKLNNYLRYVNLKNTLITIFIISDILLMFKENGITLFYKALLILVIGFIMFLFYLIIIDLFSTTITRKNINDLENAIDKLH